MLYNSTLCDSTAFLCILLVESCLHHGQFSFCSRLPYTSLLQGLEGFPTGSALLGERDSFFIPSGGERAAHTLLHWAVSDSRSRQGWACGKSLQSLQEAGVGKAGQQNEKCLWWKTDSTEKTQIMQQNHTVLDYNVKVQFIEHKVKEI